MSAMVVQDKIDSLKEKPHEEKRAVAGGIAIAVVVVLLVGWAFLFLRNIQKGAEIPTLQGGALPDDQLDSQFIQATQQQIDEYYQSAEDRYRDLRNTDSGAGSVDAGAGVPASGSSGDFGASQSDF